MKECDATIVKKRRDKKYHFIYLTTNLINSKCYLGKHSADDLTDKYLGSGKNIIKAIKKYGKENFKREILIFCASQEEAYYQEKIFSENLNVKCNPMFYNLADGGIGNPGFSHTQETKDMISNSQKERFGNDLYLAKNLSDKFKEKWKDDEFRSKFLKRRILRGRDHPQFGKHRSMELREHHSRLLKGRSKSEEHKRKISESNKGKLVSLESREKNSIAHRGRKHSESTRLNMSNSRKGEGNNMFGKQHSEQTIKKQKETLKNKPVLTCSHCGLTSKSHSNMTRWHFENCKSKIN